MASKAETVYESGLVDRIHARFPGCFVMKNNSKDYQGIPDRLVLIGPHWAMLEVKVEFPFKYEPNQEYYLQQFAEMGGFSATIYPGNEEAVLDALQTALGARR